MGQGLWDGGGTEWGGPEVGAFGNAAEGIGQVRAEPPAAPGHSPGCWRMETARRGSEPGSSQGAAPSLCLPWRGVVDATGVVLLQKRL